MAGYSARAAAGDPGTATPTPVPTTKLSAAEKAELEIESEFAQCMRDQGIDRFPDPQVNDDGFKMIGAPWE